MPAQNNILDPPTSTVPPGLTTLVRELAKVPLFIVYQLRPREGHPGKLDKVPVDPWTGHNTSAQNAPNWMLPGEALDHAMRLGFGFAAGLHGVGFVLPEDSEFFFLDLDHCTVDDPPVWSPHAVAMINRFPGAYVEISASGHGMHVLGRQAGVPPHGTRAKPAGYGMELYSKLRFCALTGIGAVGSILTDHTMALVQLIDELFTPTAADSALVDDQWTDGPLVKGYNDPGDDALIQIAMASPGSAAAVFGGGVHFRDLWTANADVLAKKWPADSPFSERPWNGSQADAALANHLFHFTGGDCERVLRLMRRPDNGLYRSKLDRDDYMRSTIKRASVGRDPSRLYKGPNKAPEAISVLREIPPPPKAREPAPPVPLVAIDASKAYGFGFILLAEQERMFAPYVYVEHMKQFYCVPDGEFVDPQNFDARFGGRQFIITPDGSRPVKRATEAYLFNEQKAFPRVNGHYFNPLHTPGNVLIDQGRKFVNTWRELDLPQTFDPFLVQPVIDHVHKLLPQGRDAEILLSYLKGIVRHKGIRSAWSVLIQGAPGNGKTFFGEMVSAVVGKQYVHRARSSQLGSRFNSALYGKLIVVCDDLNLADASLAKQDEMKELQTAKDMEIEAKGKDAKMQSLTHNALYSSNHKNAMRKSADDRRYCMLYTAQQTAEDLEAQGMNSEYFDRLFDMLEDGPTVAALRWYLHNDPIPPEFDFTKLAKRAPKSTSTDEAVRESRGAAEDELDEMIKQRRAGFRGGFICTTHVELMLRNIGKLREVHRKKWPTMLATFKYVPHPALDDGRSPEAIDGVYPQLYAKVGSAAHRLTDPAAVVAAYRKANSGQ